MEIDKFNKFVVDTYAWRKNGTKNYRRWKDTLWDMFAWNAENRFELWDSLIPTFAVINSNIDFLSYNLFCNEDKMEVNVYEIPRLIGYWKQSRMCFGLDQSGVLSQWPSFKIYCSDELPGNDEFTLVEQKMLVPVLWFDKKRCLFVEEEEFLKFNSRYVAIRGNIWTMGKDLMEIYRRMLIKCYRLQNLIFRFPKRMIKFKDEWCIEVFSLRSIFRKQRKRLDIENEHVDHNFKCVEGRFFSFVELLDEWVVNNRGISSLAEFYEAGGKEEEVGEFFDATGTRKRMQFGGESAVGDGSSTVHPSSSNSEQ
jgi:hypothetical protein